MSEFGTRHPDAPRELDLFAFLAGRWDGSGLGIDTPGEPPKPYSMTWVGRFIMGGHAFPDEARILDADGNIERVFVSYRYVDPKTGDWYTEAHHVLESRLVPQTPNEVGGVQAPDDGAIVVTSLIQPSIIGRETFRADGSNAFTFQLDVSTDGGENWIERVDRIDATRAASPSA